MDIMIKTVKWVLRFIGVLGLLFSDLALFSGSVGFGLVIF